MLFPPKICFAFISKYFVFVTFYFAYNTITVSNKVADLSWIVDIHILR